MYETILGARRGRRRDSPLFHPSFAFLASSSSSPFSFVFERSSETQKETIVREEKEGERCERSGWRGMESDGRGLEGKVRAGSRSREVSEPALRGRNASKGPRIMTSRTAHVAIR